MIIREARIEDIERLLEIYEIAKAFMRQTGNLHQWNSSYPSRELLEGDIEAHHLFVMEEEHLSETICIVKEHATLHTESYTCILKIRFIFQMTN